MEYNYSCDRKEKDEKRMFIINFMLEIRKFKNFINKNII